MKKIIKTTLLVILGIIVVSAIAAAILLFGPEKKVENVRRTVTDNQGNAYVLTTDAKGESYAIVGDKDGNVWQVEVDSNGVLGETKDSLNGKVDNADVLTTYTGPEVSVSIREGRYTGSVGDVNGDTSSTTTPQETPSTTRAGTQAPTNAPETSNGNQPTRSTAPTTSGNAGTTAGTTAAPTKPGTSSAPERTTKPSNSSEPYILQYRKMFQSGSYYMEFTTNDPDLGSSPIVSAAKNGNVLVSTTLEGINLNMLYLADKDKTYLVIHDYKKYCSVPQDLLGEDFDMSEMSFSNQFANDVTADRIKTKNVRINGKTLLCEYYTAGDGSLMNYYFDNGTLVRLDNVLEDGTTNETYISKITSNVDDSVFEIPKGYGYLNLSWLNFLAGGNE